MNTVLRRGMAMSIMEGTIITEMAPMEVGVPLCPMGRTIILGHRLMVHLLLGLTARRLLLLMDLTVLHRRHHLMDLMVLRRHHLTDLMVLRHRLLMDPMVLRRHHHLMDLMDQMLWRTVIGVCRKVLIIIIRVIPTVAAPRVLRILGTSKFISNRSF